jgi:hypothetical protein
MRTEYVVECEDDSYYFPTRQQAVDFASRWEPCNIAIMVESWSDKSPTITRTYTYIQEQLS